MRLLTVNAWGGALHGSLLPWLSAADADVVCLQEVTRTARRSGWSTFADGERSLPQRLNLLDDVSCALVGYSPYFVTSDSGPVVDADGVEQRQDFGVATWVRDDHPVVGIDARFVHSRFADHTEWAVADRPRAALTVTVHDRTADRTVSVIQLHGLRDPAGKQDTRARVEQAVRLAGMVESARSTADLTVLCGDLNVLPTSDTFRLLREVGMVDLVGSADTRASGYTKDVRSASYLLVSSMDAVRRFTVVTEPEVSDHRALVLEI